MLAYLNCNILVYDGQNKATVSFIIVQLPSKNTNNFNGFCIQATSSASYVIYCESILYITYLIVLLEVES
jgi:hypothetical protein